MAEYGWRNTDGEYAAGSRASGMMADDRKPRHGNHGGADTANCEPDLESPLARI